LTAAGNLELMSVDKLGLICSSQCPGNLVLKTYDYVRELRDRGIVLAGGFHSPMERECLGILLRGKQPIVICPARSIDGMRLPDEWRLAFEAGRLLIISVFGPSERRITRELASRRNAMVASMCQKLLVPHAAPGSTTLRLCLALLSQGKAIETFDHEANREILDAGAARVDAINGE
jgi:predicted Rossmann fold nucleotide-binding protein DprA/Smf involved in DNA uptake